MALSNADKQFIADAIVAGIATYAATAPIVAAPVAEAASTTVKGYATVADRVAGKGFSCSCGRDDLRTAPKPGKSFHRAPDGSTHTV